MKLNLFFARYDVVMSKECIVIYKKNRKQEPALSSFRLNDKTKIKISYESFEILI